MAASNNDNQGLKIAVACFVMLSVILAVTTYFGFSNYSLSDKKLTDKESELRNANQEAERLIRVLNDVKERLGFVKASNDEDLAKQLDKALTELQKKATTYAEDQRKQIDSYKGSGGALGKMDELKQSVDAINTGFATPKMSFYAALERQSELLNNQAAIATALGLEFHDLRKQHEDMNGVNAKTVEGEVATVKKAKEDLESEHNDHETKRTALMAKVDALQSELNKSEQKVQKLSNDLAQAQDDYRKKGDDLLHQLNNWRDQAQKQDKVLDKKDGLVKFVDHTLNEIRSDITRRQGAREQMILSVFDRNAAGIPSDKVKGTVQLIKVTETGSLGKILSVTNPSDPIRAGDQLYSAAWSPNRPQQFALIGKMDINRDGRDDRADLKRMIESAGGVISYDLPPPGVGKETGQLTPLIRWYVEDSRLPIRGMRDSDANAELGESEKKFNEDRTKAIAEARRDGIVPISIERLLDQLGYHYDADVPGKVEAQNIRARDALLYPRGRVPAPAPTETPSEEKKDAEKPPAEDPK